MNKIDVYLVNYNELNFKENYKKYFKYLNDEELNRIKKYENKFDQIRSLLGLLLIKSLASEKNINPNIKKTEYGKPYLLNSDLHFNISHANECVAVGISNNDLGIDLEYIKNEDYNFYNDWTTRECFFKLIGLGLIMYNDEYNIDYKRSIINYKKSNYSFTNLIIDKYMLSICSKNKFEVKLKYLTNLDLIKLLNNLKQVIY